MNLLLLIAPGRAGNQQIWNNSRYHAGMSNALSLGLEMFPIPSCDNINIVKGISFYSAEKLNCNRAPVVVVGFESDFQV